MLIVLLLRKLKDFGDMGNSLSVPDARSEYKCNGSLWDSSDSKPETPNSLTGASGENAIPVQHKGQYEITTACPESLTFTISCQLRMDMGYSRTSLL